MFLCGVLMYRVFERRAEGFKFRSLYSECHTSIMPLKAPRPSSGGVSRRSSADADIENRTATPEGIADLLILRKYTT
jgi:hypothetical protein